MLFHQHRLSGSAVWAFNPLSQAFRNVQMLQQVPTPVITTAVLFSGVKQSLHVHSVYTSGQSGTVHTSISAFTPHTPLAPAFSAQTACYVSPLTQYVDWLLLTKSYTITTLFKS